MIKHRLNTMKYRPLVEKDRGNACRKNQEKKMSLFFWRIFLEVSVFTALTVGNIVLLPQGRIQEIKHMLLGHLTHGLFLTWTQKSHHLQIIYYNIFLFLNASFNPTPCSPLTRVYLLGEPTSLLVVANTHPPLSLVCQTAPPFASPPTLSHPTVQVTIFLTGCIVSFLNTVQCYNIFGSILLLWNTKQRALCEFVVETGYNIYIDDISNSRLPRLAHTFPSTT